MNSAILYTTLMLFVLSASRMIYAAEPLQVGDAAPNFSLEGTDGEKHTLAEFKGKMAVVIAWYPRAFTRGCTAECKSFKEDGDKIRQYKVAYFTASTDDVEKNKAFAKELGLDYTILSDPDGRAATAYGLYDPTRKAAARTTYYIGKDGLIMHIDEKVNTKSHGADVAARLEALGVERN